MLIQILEGLMAGMRVLSVHQSVDDKNVRNDKNFGCQRRDQHFACVLCADVGE